MMLCFIAPLQCSWDDAYLDLMSHYQIASTVPSDMYEHVPTLRLLAKECSSVVECGLNAMNSSWGLLAGLNESQGINISYLGIDISVPPQRTLNLAKQVSNSLGIQFRFLQANDLDVEIEPVDLLFIDTWHTYRQLTCELEKFAPFINKYIAMHDTSDPYGSQDESNPNSRELPQCSTVSIDPSKHGLWPAVVDFLERHPEWSLKRRYLNCHGLTILQRVR